LGLRSNTLSDEPSEGGVYSEANIQQRQLERLAEPRLRSRIDAALRGTGISTAEVVARMEAGASTAALKREKVLRRDGVIEEAREVRAHLTEDRIEEAADAVRLETSLVERDEAVIETRAVERLEDEQRAYLRDRPELIQSPTDVIRMDEEGRARIVDQTLADRLSSRASSFALPYRPRGRSRTPGRA